VTELKRADRNARFSEERTSALYGEVEDLVQVAVGRAVVHVHDLETGKMS
jgi:hypothetical protein